MGGGGGGGRGPDPPEKYKNIGFLSNTGPDPLKTTKLQIQHSMLGHDRPASETPFKWRFACGPLMARYWWYLDPSSPQQTKKKLSNGWTPSDKTLWIRACFVLYQNCMESLKPCHLRYIYSHSTKIDPYLKNMTMSPLFQFLFLLKCA